jgi:hypothetical protein
MKKLLVLFCFIVGNAWALTQDVPLLGVERNKDHEQIGLVWEHEQAVGTERRFYKDAQWFQGARRSIDRIGIKVVKPATEHLTLSSEFGVIRGNRGSQETIDMSGLEYNEDGEYLSVSVMYHFN